MQQQNMGERTPQGTPRHAGPKPLNTPEELRAIRQAMDEGKNPLLATGVPRWEDQVGVSRIINRRVLELEPLPTPAQVLAELPLDSAAQEIVAYSRDEIRACLYGQDDRLLVIVGPCSVHDPNAALDYAHRLSKVMKETEGELLIVMRVYFEKPRTTVGWKGLINDPDIDGSHNIRKGLLLSFVPEDRLGMGLVGSMGMTGNMMLRSWRKGGGIFLDRKDPEALANRIWQELEVVTPSTSFPVRRMSGGNVQKVLVGREIAQQPAVLMTAYAVRGLDINTSYTIYNLLTEQKMKGVAVVYVGEDLDVLLELCDRIVVLCGGQVSGVVDARTTDKHQVGALMTLVNKGGKADE